MNFLVSFFVIGTFSRQGTTLYDQHRSRLFTVRLHGLGFRNVPRR